MSETQLLQAIWMGTLILGLLSIVTMIVLIARRAAMERKELGSVQRRLEISQCFYAALRSPVAIDAESLPAVTRTDYPDIVRIALNTLRSVRGEDTRRVVNVVELWGLSPYLHNLAKAGRKGKRIQALTLLGYFSDAASLDLLARHAGDRDMYVQIAALRGLALRGATQHLGTIARSLTHTGQTNTPMLSDILRRFGEPAVPSLLDIARSAAETEVRLAVLMALGDIGSLAAVDALLGLCDDPDIDVRAESLVALGKIGDSRAADTIVRHLHEREATVRMNAAQALGQLLIMSTLPQLTACLSDEDWQVRFQAAKSLHRFGERGIATLKAAGGQEGRAGLIARQVLAENRGVT